jgi:hypothetical protein
VLVVEHDEVGQVRPRQEEGRGVRHEHDAVEERGLVEAASAGEVQNDRREEEDRGVEVEHRRDERDDCQRDDEQAVRPDGDATEP